MNPRENPTFGGLNPTKEGLRTSKGMYGGGPVKKRKRKKYMGGGKMRKYAKGGGIRKAKYS